MSQDPAPPIPLIPAQAGTQRGIVASGLGPRFRGDERTSRREPPPEPSDRAVSRQTLAGSVLAALRERILRGELAAGEPLRQDALAAELGVSRIPLREALKQLEAEGLVTVFPHRGAVVADLPLGEIEELFDVRALVEPDLLRRAVPRLAAADIEAAAAILDAYEAALVDDAGVSQWGELNWRFHSALYAPARRPRTLKLLHGIHNQVDRYLRLQILLTRGKARAQDDHRRLLALSAARRGEEAAELLRRHILDAGADLVAFLADRQRSARNGG